MGGYVLLAVIVIVVIAIVIDSDKRAAQKVQRRKAANDAYQGALSELKASPSNPDLKQRTLELGRTYANLTREQKGVTVFDEVALSNDISAATAGASAPPAAAPRVSVETRLQELEGLRTKGLISASEYDEKRRRLITEM
jgi:hypothetical protein